MANEDRPLVAVVGDANKARYPELVRKAAHALGAELARQGCRILVFSTDQAMVEWEVVQGYLGNGSAIPDKSIEVRYPPDFEGRFPGEAVRDPRFVRIQRGGDWEASFYPSFARLDGIVLIGGGYTTKIAGLLALGATTPMFALGGLGGAAHDVWAYASADRNRTASDEDLNLMALGGWDDQSAAACVRSLREQRLRKLEAQKEAALLASGAKRNRTLMLFAAIGCALFALVLAAIVESMASKVPRSLLWIVFGVPALAGASGATIRTLWDQRNSTSTPMHPLGMTVALGFWVSGVAGALFVLPQIWIMGSIEKADFVKLASFAIPIGLVAGLTLDRIFPRLLKYDVPLNTPALTKAAGSPAAKQKRAPG